MKNLQYIQEGIGRSYKKLENYSLSPLLRKILFVSVVLVSFVLIYVLNVLQPIFGDDWVYSMSGEGSRLENFGQLLRYQYNHYFVWGGRIVVHVIAQLLLWAGISLGDLLNSMAYVAFTLAIYYLVKDRNQKYNISLLIIINLLHWLLQPAFAQTFLWITGSANYLWGTLIIITFIIPFKRFVFDPVSKDGISKSILFFLWGILAGWTNENMAVALVFMLFVLLCYFKIQKKILPKWTVAGFAGVIVGAVILIAAPGNYLRYEDFGDEHRLGLMTFVRQFAGSVAGFYYYALPLAFIFLLTFAMYRTCGKKVDRQGVNFLAILFFMGSVVAALAMTAAPFFPGRAAFGLNTLLIVGIGILYAHLDFKQVLVKRIAYISVIFALMFFAAEYYRGYRELSHAHAVLAKRIEFLEDQKQKGEKNIVFKDEILKSETRFFHYWELPQDSTDWHNRMFSNYHGIETVIVVHENE